MSKRLEDFVKDNRDAFDKFEPGPVVWNNIRQQLEKDTRSKKGILVSMKAIRWSAAAAIIILLGAGAYFLWQTKPQTQTPQVAHAGKKTNDLPVITPNDSAHPSTANPANEQPTTDNDQLAAAGKDEYSEEMYHLTRLVELKQDEIKRVTKDEPLLYQQFAGDINKLDSTFHTLKTQLPHNPNREQLLEAMIQNLQLQEALLNRQLNIIKKINNVKKTEYEKAHTPA
ncbi:MAG TPA: hypothetical protein VLD19_13865 [Chitinophagaceae bacterium]|nr:hypothetical protein [Chitinophagaceae bacterium]